MCQTTTDNCISDNPEDYEDRVSAVYNGKTLFITGGTGFLGKVFVEKLLRTCSGLSKIYLLMRAKKGKDPNTRLKEVFANPLFDTLRKQQSDFMNKVTAIQGDCSELGLGLSPEDRQKIIDEVNIFFHCAATIRFDEPLKKAVLLNVRGTKLMLELAKEVKNLEFFCHVSTSYCHLKERVLYEKPYPPPASPHHIIKCCEWMSEEIIDSITDKLLGDIPNTYAFTKALGEALVVEQMDNLPVIIARPSIVIPIWKEPLPGWTDNINGPTGLLIGAGKGVIRTMYCVGDSYADYLPVDIAVNCLIISVWNYTVNNKSRIYNLTSSSEIKISWEEIIEIGRAVINTKMPLNWVVWYPGGSMKKQRWLHNLAFFFFHIIPAIFLDGLILLFGQKPIMCRVQRRIKKGFEVFEYYANNQWDFSNEEAMKARMLLNPKERRNYKVDSEGLDMFEYFTNCTHCARLYILGETDDQIPTAKRHMKVMWFVDKLCKTLILLTLAYYFFKLILCPIFGIEI